MKSLFFLICLLSASSLFSEIIFGTHPLKGGVESWKQFEPFSTYLSRTLGESVTVRVAKDYEEQEKLVGEDQIDIAFMGPTLFVEMQSSYGKKHLLAKLEVKGSPHLYGIIFAHKNSKIQTLEDFKYKIFAFGSPLSTMSHLIPRYMLVQADLEGQYSYRFLGNHINVALGVLMGDFDGGAVKEEVFEKFKHRGLKMIARSQPFSEHVFVATDRLSAERVADVKAALFAIPDNPDSKKIMEAINPEMSGILTAKNKDYDNLRAIIEHLKAKQIIP